MYGSTHLEEKDKNLDQRIDEDPVKLAEFEARIEAGEKD